MSHIAKRFFAQWIGKTTVNQLPQKWRGAVTGAVEHLENEVCASASCEQGNLFSYFI
jgi:hypothetical protein